MRRIFFVWLLAAMCSPAYAETSADVGKRIEMVELPGGTFLMGAPPEEKIAGRTQHRVTIKPFRMAKYETTFDQFDAYAKATGARLPDDEGTGRGRHPVMNVEWDEIQAFIAWLNKGTGRRFRLPSEAEWEYAARGGTATAYWWGQDFEADRLNSMVNTGKDVWEGPAPVGSFAPNPFGLYDTAGNIIEFVADCWHYDFAGAPSDGSARNRPGCIAHVVRGGSWFVKSLSARSDTRSMAARQFTSIVLGFRLAEDLPSH